MKLLAKIYMAYLVIAALGMTIWGVAGFFEYFTGIVPFIKLQNAAYPSGVQFVHWLLISLSGLVFLSGYMRRWKWTPIAMIILYTDLTVLCTIQTFDFMSDQWGYPQYFFELASYVVHALFLLYSGVSKSRFGNVSHL